MSSDIYVGIWTNWSRGFFWGQTLTTTKHYGNLLIAFTALFITFAASRLWRICCLVLHRCYSTAADRNTIHHQLQVILRNSRAADSAFFELFSLFWAWRKPQFRRVAGLIPLIVFSACFLAAFTVAGGFSSNISSSIGDEVLINSQTCGMIEANTTVEGRSRRNRWLSELSNNAANYAEQCYRTNQTDTTTACNKFVRSSLRTHAMNTTAECPFQSRICRRPQSALRLDSGYIDSNDDLGLNAPMNERFAYRYVVHCAPLETNNYVTHVKDNDRGWDMYHYGFDVIGPADNRSHSKDYMYKIEDLNLQYDSPFGVSLAGNNFKLGFDNIGMFRGEPDAWFPIPELVRRDGDLSIAFLSGNGVRFIEIMDDDWYRATTPWQNIYYTSQSGTQRTWHPDVSASPMGCLEQFQWCNSAYPRDRGCGPLASYLDSIYGAAPLFNVTDDTLDAERPIISDATQARIMWIWQTMTNHPRALPSLLQYLGTRSLASQSKLFSGLQSSLPDNQWQLDVLQWWFTALAAVQASRIRYGPLANLSTKIRSATHTSFSCFGLYFTFVTGALITLTSYILEPILNCLHRRRQHKSYAHLEWISNGSLQLHRMAHEQLMDQQWANCTEDIPTTNADIFLANLDISDPEHPIIRRPRPLKVSNGVIETSYAAQDSSSPDGGSNHSGSAAELNGPVSTSSMTSVSDSSWTLDVRMTLMNVSGQLSLEESEQDDAEEDTEDAAPGNELDAVENLMAGRNN